jgi:hypothetical protein
MVNNGATATVPLPRARAETSVPNSVQGFDDRLAHGEVRAQVVEVDGVPAEPARASPGKPAERTFLASLAASSVANLGPGSGDGNEVPGLPGTRRRSSDSDLRRIFVVPRRDPRAVAGGLRHAEEIGGRRTSEGRRT